MPPQQAQAGDHAWIIQIQGDQNTVGPWPHLRILCPSLAPRPVDTVRSETDWLRPGVEATTFVGREALLDAFIAWAQFHDPVRPVSVRVVHGGAGVGKTRFARELCRALGPDWQAGFVTGREARRFLSQTNLGDWGWQTPTLVVFDYAVSLVDVLPDWLSELCTVSTRPYPLRLLFLERQAAKGSGWLEQAFPGGFGPTAACPRDLLDGEPIRLPGMTEPEVQRTVMQQMLDRLGSTVTLPPDDAAFRTQLAATDWAGAPLYLMMAAMVMHRQGSMAKVLHLGRVDLAHFVANHELNRLLEVCGKNTAWIILLPHLAAFATLCGGLSGDAVLAAIRREKTAIGCDSLDPAVGEQRLRGLLPDDNGGIAPIRPDIVGEAFVLTRLGKGQATDGARAVVRAFGEHPSEVAAVLVRCVQDFAPRSGPETADQGNNDQQQAIAWLQAVADTPDLPLRPMAALLDALPQQTVALRSLALDWQQRTVTLLRNKVTEQPDLKTTLAISLNNLAVRLSAVGDYDEALKAAQEAVDILRDLANANPDAFRPYLAGSLNNLANRLSAVGKRDQALKAAQEATDLYTVLADANPDAFRPDLAGSLNNLANRLSAVGRRKEALKAAQEAVDIRRDLAGANPDAFRPDLADSLNNLANSLSDLGRRKEALKAAQETAELYTILADANPDAFRPDLAMSLNNLANRLSEVGKRDLALKAAQESVTLYRDLADANPDAFRPDLAGSLNNLAYHLSNVGKCDEAIVSARESARIYYQLCNKFPDAFKDNFTIAMTTWLSLCHGVSRKEAFTLLQQAPEAHIRDLCEGVDDATDTPPNEGA